MGGNGLFKRLFGGETGPVERRLRPRTQARPDTRFLIIDDSPTIVTVLRRMLQQNGFATREAYDAERGIEIAEAEVPHLIFLDIVLPGMSGFEALRHLRRSPTTRNIPIIMISGNEQATEQFYLQRIGADDFMKKPFNRDEVFSRIGRLLGPDLLPQRPEQSRPDGSFGLRAAV
jgi:DNA-binding response OmpR family regulator